MLLEKPALAMKDDGTHQRKEDDAIKETSKYLSVSDLVQIAHSLGYDNR